MAELSINRAMVLAAGLGQRMRPLTNTKPKPLVPFMGKPLIDHVLERLRRAGVAHFVVNVHYCAEQLITHLETVASNDTITISDERDQLMDTGGGITKALDQFGSEAFYTHNSDSVWLDAHGTSTLSRLAATWRDADMDFLMLLARPEDTLGYAGKGDFAYCDPQRRVRRRRADDTDALVFTGVSITHPRAFADAPTGPYSLNVLWDAAIEKRRAFGVTLDGTWMHIGTPDALLEAEAWLDARGAKL